MSRTVERRPWPTDPRYLAGDDGSIVGPRGWPLTPWITDGGYQQVQVSRDAQHRGVTVHIIVCEAWHGPRPDGMEVAHANGDRLDCRPVNLSWKTRADNHADKHAHGTAQQGERANNHKLTDVEVLDIRRRAAAGEGAVALGRAFSVNRGTIHRITSRRGWVHI